MRLLLDTNALLWWFSDDPTLPASVDAMIDDPANTVLVSAAGPIAGAHKDPFDRMIAARALIENVPLVTNDAAFAGFGVNVLW